MSMSEWAFRFLFCLYRLSGSVCGMKSPSWPGTLYSYGPRWTSIGLVKLPCGGGVGVCHSSVVPPHGLSEGILRPLLMLMKKLRMNGICETNSNHAAQEMCLFACRTDAGIPIAASLCA